MAREPTLPQKDVVALEDMIAWVKRAKDSSEMLERIKGLQAFVELHPRLREAAQAYRPRPRTS